MKTRMKPFINIFKQTFQFRHWIGTFALTALLSVASCESKQDQNNGSNVGTAQDEMEVDTTSSASRGGTTESTGRANTDTSGTGKASNTPR
jgi:hypothetical protein